MRTIQRNRRRAGDLLRGLSAAALVFNAAGCGSADRATARSDSGTVAMLPPVAVRPPAPGDPSCPRTGLWAPCALVDRIVHAGLSFKATGDTVHQKFFAVPGIQYRVALTDTMVAFFFKDSIALRDAIAPLDTVRMAPRTDTTMPWPARPAVIRSGNLLALYFATSDRQIERIRLAITAGAPF